MQYNTKIQGQSHPTETHDHPLLKSRFTANFIQGDLTNGRAEVVDVSSVLSVETCTHGATVYTQLLYYTK